MTKLALLKVQKRGGSGHFRTGGPSKLIRTRNEEGRKLGKIRKKWATLSARVDLARKLGRRNENSCSVAGQKREKALPKGNTEGQDARRGRKNREDNSSRGGHQQR